MAWYCSGQDNGLTYESSTASPPQLAGDIPSSLTVCFIGLVMPYYTYEGYRIPYSPAEISSETLAVPEGCSSMTTYHLGDSRRAYLSDMASAAKLGGCSATQSVSHSPIVTLPV